jgi:BirA family biotin operon repressor/biotin-[acetyl-CoA-carboxylase] ligase
MQASDATPPQENFAKSRRTAATLGWSFRHVSSTGSTNADLVAEARRGDRGPAVLTTDHQTAGRGRLDRTWLDDGESQLMVSVRLPAAGLETAWITGAVAAAARTAIAWAGAPIGFKWPNDLMIESTAVTGKLAGVLAEYVAGPPDVAVVGMGLNIGPPGIDGAASLREVGISLGRDEFLAGLLAALPERLADPARVRAELREFSVTLGRRVRVERPGDDLIGEAIDMDETGRLILDVDGETHAVSVGDVVHLRAAEA